MKFLLNSTYLTGSRSWQDTESCSERAGRCPGTPTRSLFNQSLECGTIQTNWSQAIFTPVYKKGVMHSPDNYRPVSLKCLTCKLLEHNVICTHILSFIDEHHSLRQLQNGFRKGKSCETQLLIEDFMRNYDKKIKWSTDIGVLDLSLTLDNVPHEQNLTGWPKEASPVYRSLWYAIQPVEMPNHPHLKRQKEEKEEKLYYLCNEIRTTVNNAKYLGI